jgi:hypothetical protein
MTLFRFMIGALSLTLFLVLALPDPAPTFFLWKTCMKVDSSFYHHIIDPDLLEIGNDKYWTIVGVTCEGVPRRHAFSMCANGCPLFPNSAVRIARNRIKVCEGDSIFVGNAKCEIDDFEKEAWPNR